MTEVFETEVRRQFEGCMLFFLYELEVQSCQLHFRFFMGTYLNLYGNINLHGGWIKLFIATYDCAFITALFVIGSFTWSF